MRLLESRIGTARGGVFGHPSIGMQAAGLCTEPFNTAETKGLHIDLDSTVAAQFGRQIRKVIEETLTGFGLEDADVKAVDKGARDCTIRARVTAAAVRATGKDVWA